MIIKIYYILNQLLIGSIKCNICINIILNLYLFTQVSYGFIIIQLKIVRSIPSFTKIPATISKQTRFGYYETAERKVMIRISRAHQLPLRVHEKNSSRGARIRNLHVFVYVGWRRGDYSNSQQEPYRNATAGTRRPFL